MSLNIETLSPDQAKKLILLSQRVPPVNSNGTAIQATLSTIEHLGYVQIDTISVVQRAHHHTLWSRNPEYQPDQLDQLVAKQKIFEYWSHAAAYLPMRYFRFSLVRKHAFASGLQNHWYERDEKLMKKIMTRIKNEGPLMAKDFENTSKRKVDWSSKPAKRALENLYMQGDLMIPYRNNFHKVYDLTERVIPNDINTSMPTKEEYIQFLIVRYLEANGLGIASEIAYLLKNTKSEVEKYLKEMHLNGEILQVKIGELKYYTLPDSLNLLNEPLSRSKLVILSPFDNLLIQRKRIKTLFNFDYQIECYVPESKRKFGYFSLPILWDGNLVARMDCKADRKTSILHINHLALEPSLKSTDEFSHALSNELATFMKFNNCDHLTTHKITPNSFNIKLI